MIVIGRSDVEVPQSSALEQGDQQESFSDRIGCYLDSHTFGVLLIGSIVYFAITLLQSASKPFWYDELFTFYISRLPRISDIVAALGDGIDQLPLPYFLLERFSQSAIGATGLGFRLPSVLGFWLGLVCIFFFVKKRTSTMHAIVAALIPLASTFVYRYAYEARPYGLLFGFASAALLSWQSAAEQNRRRLSLFCLSASLLGAAASHYYAILLLIPIGIGEAVRLFQSRRWDWPVSICCLAAGGFLPIAHVKTNLNLYGANFWSRPRPGFFVEFYGRMLEPLLVPAAFLLLIVTIYATRHRAQIAKPVNTRPLPRSEMAAIVALFLLPFAGMAIAYLVTNAIVPRYVLPAAIGFSLLFGVFLYFASAGKSLFAAWAILCFGAGFGINSLHVLRVSRAESTVRIPAAALDSALPIVFENPLYFFETVHATGSKIGGRLFYLVDPPTARANPYASLDPGLLFLNRVAAVNVRRLSDFEGSQKQFLVLCELAPDHEKGWIVQRLMQQGAPMQLVEAKDSHRLYRVNLR